MKKRKLILPLFLIFVLCIIMSEGYGGDEKVIGEATQGEGVFKALSMDWGDTGKPGSVAVGHVTSFDLKDGEIAVTQTESELSDESLDTLIRELGDTGKPGSVAVGHLASFDLKGGEIVVTQTESELSDEAFEKMIREMGDTGKPGKVIPHL